MKRTLLFATVAIAVLLGGSMAVILVLTSPGSVGPPDEPVQLGPPTAMAPAAIAPPSADASRPPTLRGLGGTKARAAWSAPAKIPSDTPRADRVTRKAIRKALLAAPIQSRLAHCADQLGGFGGMPSAIGRVPRAAPASLMLEIETLGGELRIIDVQVREWGGASPVMVACARNVLRDQIVAAPGSRMAAGQRKLMPFPLNPRSETVGSSRAERGDTPETTN